MEKPNPQLSTVKDFLGIATSAVLLFLLIAVAISLSRKSENVIYYLDENGKVTKVKPGTQNPNNPS